MCEFHINVLTRHHLVIDAISVVMASAILAPPGFWRLMCHIGNTWFGAILAHGVCRFEKFGKSQEFEKQVKKFVNSQEIHQYFQEVWKKRITHLKEYNT